MPIKTKKIQKKKGEKEFDSTQINNNNKYGRVTGFLVCNSEVKKWRRESTGRGRALVLC
jgi:hypothetical protein